MNKKTVKNLSDQEKIRLMNEAYDKFLREIRKIEKDRDSKINKLIKKLENMQIDAIRKSIK